MATSVNPLLLPVKKDTETIRVTVLENILKMLCNRNWIKKENFEQRKQALIDDNNDDHLYKIKLDVELGKFATYSPTDLISGGKKPKPFTDDTVIIKLLPQKITSIGKSPIVTDFLSLYAKFHKILIVDEISEKSKSQFLLHSPCFEIFAEPYFMIW